MMFKPAYCLLLVCAIVPLVAAIPPPKCKDGYGLTDPNNDAYGTAKPGDCKKCVVSGCRTCLGNYKKCETCDAGKGLNSSKDKCTKCSDKNCGVCNDNYKKCDAKISECSTSVSKVATGAKKGAYAPDSNFNYCQSEPGFDGNGYSSMFTATVIDGVCIDCNSEQFRPYSDGGVDFCTFNKVGMEVAANAFSKKSGCDYPKSIKFTLKNTCLSQSKNFPFSINLIYSASYCGEKLTVISSGGGRYVEKGDGYSTVIDPASKWKYIIKP